MSKYIDDTVIFVWDSCGDTGYRIPWAELKLHSIYPWSMAAHMAYPLIPSISLVDEASFVSSPYRPTHGHLLPSIGHQYGRKLLISRFINQEVLDTHELISAIQTEHRTYLEASRLASWPLGSGISVGPYTDALILGVGQFTGPEQLAMHMHDRLFEARVVMPEIPGWFTSVREPEMRDDSNGKSWRYFFEIGNEAIQYLHDTTESRLGYVPDALAKLHNELVVD